VADSLSILFYNDTVLSHEAEERFGGPARHQSRPPWVE